MKEQNLIHILPLYGQILSEDEVQLVKQAELVFGGKYLLAKMSELVPNFPVNNQELHTIGANFSATVQYIGNCYSDGKKILVLADGDPLYFGIGASLARLIGSEKLCVHAGISILQRLCALLAMPWHEVINISLHGRKDAWQKLYAALMTGKPVCVLTDAASTPALLAKALLERGAQNLTLHVLEKYTEEGEKLTQLSLEEALNYTASQPLTVLFTHAKNVQRPYLGMPADFFARDGELMTKAEVRAVAFSLLRIESGQTFWDIGAGSGSVALEASGMAGRVIALEQNAKRVQDIHENRRRVGALNVDIVHGAFPECAEILDDFPRPHRIFVGGGLSQGKAHAALEKLSSALESGGRMLISAVLLGTLQSTQKYFQQKGWPMQIIHLQVSEALPLNIVPKTDEPLDVRFVPQNPVFLICVEKPI